MPIPLKIHQIWLDFGKGVRVPPAQYDKLRESWVSQNPGFEYVLWDDTMANALMSTHFPNTNWNGLMPIQKADVLRICILLHHGGVYADMDAECMRSIAWLCKNKQLVLVERRASFGLVGVTNCFMMSEPGHPFLLHVLDCMAATSRRKRGEILALYINRSYGSIKVSRAWNSWNGSRKHVRILGGDDFWNPGTERQLELALAGKIKMPYAQHQQHQSWGADASEPCKCRRAAPDTVEKLCFAGMKGITYAVFAAVLVIMIRWSWIKGRKFIRDR